MAHRNSEFEKLKKKILPLSIKIHKCVVFEKFAEPDECVCGLSREEHVNIEEEEENKEDGIRWQRSSNTLTADTNAYGRVIFNGQMRLAAEYLRLSFDTGSDTYKRIIKDIWDIQKPELALFIIGECEDEGIRFVDTLIDTALVTDRFVITEGCHAGVAKIFAEKAANINKGLLKKLKIVGVAHWGSLRDYKCLLNDWQKNEGKMDKMYHVDTRKEDINSLDPNHTHFLLVDDAVYRKRITDLSINFVVKQLSDMGAVVMVAFDEKVNTIKTVLRNIEYGIPCIMITKTDKLNKIFDNALEKLNGLENYDQKKRDEIEKDFSSLFFDQVKEDEDSEFKLLHPKIKVKQSAKRKLFVYLNLETTQKEFERIILQLYLGSALDPEKQATAIIKTLGTVLMNWKQHVLFDEFFLKNTDIDISFVDLLEKLIISVKLNNIDFVKLLLKFLLSYNSKIKSRVKIAKNIDNLESIEKTLRKVLDDKTFCISRKSNLVNTLFLIACNLGNYETAFYLASVDDYPLANYFVGLKIFNYSKDIHLSGHMQIVINQAIDSFQKAACELFEEVYAQDELKAYQMLFVQVPQYKNRNCIKLAEWAECLDFLSIKAVTLVFDRTYSYWGQFCSFFSCNKEKKYEVKNEKKDAMCFSFACPKCLDSFRFAAVTRVFRIAYRFFGHFSLFAIRRKQKRRQDKKIQDEQIDLEANHNGTKNPKETLKLNKLNNQTENGEDSLKKKARDPEEPDKQTPMRKREFWKLLWLLRMPIMIYLFYYLSFLTFLGLFGYVLIHNFYPVNHRGPSTPEYLVMLWIFSFIFDGFYIIVIKRLELDDPLPFNCETFKYIITNPKNWAVPLYMVGMILRFMPSLNCYYAARIVLSIDFLVWIVELFEGLKGSRRMGIFFVMIQDMSLKTGEFMLLIFVTMIGYGITAQALMYPNQQGSFFHILGNIFFPSFFVIVGNDFRFEQLMTFGKCTFNDSRNTTYEFVNDYNDKENICPDALGSFVAVIIHTIYLITLVILLLNLLIALLNNIYQGIQDESKKYFNLLFVQHSYKYRFLKTVMPPPLNLLWILYVIYLICVNDRRWKKTKGEKNELIRHFKKYDAEAILSHVDPDNLVGYQNYYDALYSPKSLQDLINFTGFHAEQVFRKIHEKEKNKYKEKPNSE